MELKNTSKSLSIEIVQQFLYNQKKSKTSFLKNCKINFSKKDYTQIEDKIYLFPNGISLSNIETIAFPKQTLSLIYVGRLINYKGVEYLIDACKLLRREYTCTIIGDGSDRERLEKLSQGMPINFVGEKQFCEIEQYLTQSHVLILPSFTENLPNVILEALAMSIPVIATSVGAIPEIVESGKNGFLVKPRSSIEIVAAIEQLFSSEAISQNFKNQARKSVQSYIWSYVLPQLESTIKTIIGRHA